MSRKTFGAHEKGGWNDGVEITVHSDGDISIDLQLAGDTNGMTGCSSTLGRNGAVAMAEWVLQQLAPEKLR